jgi:hypothetical protein
MFPNKPTNAVLSAQQRRQREDDAPRLTDVVSGLAALSIRIDEKSVITAPKYVRRFVVNSAPAVFIVPCSDQNCGEGGHDITTEVVGALRSHRRNFSGTHVCSGWIGSDRCTRTIWYEVEAEFAAG